VILAARFAALRAMVEGMLSYGKFGRSAAVCEFLEIDRHTRFEANN
jgi:hypothetical protein